MNKDHEKITIWGLSNANSPSGQIVRRMQVNMLLLTLIIFFATVASNAQTAAVYGQLGNFDVVNNTGHEGHGFEIELQGLQPNDIYYSFSYQRYGAAHITATATGVLVRWESSYTNGAFDQTTVQYAGTGQFGAIQSMAPSVGVEVSPVNVRDPAEIERGVAAFARSGNGGLIVTASGSARPGPPGQGWWSRHGQGIRAQGNSTCGRAAALV